MINYTKCTSIYSQSISVYNTRECEIVALIAGT